MHAFTALFGAYDRVWDAPPGGGTLLTDQHPGASRGWEARVIAPPCRGEPARSNRAVKLQPHRWLPLGWVLYHDASMRLRVPPDVVLARFRELAGRDAPAYFLRHSLGHTTSDEFAWVAQRKYTPPAVLEAQRQATPVVVMGHPTIEGRLYTADTRDPTVRTLFDAWWARVARYSHRDQLSFPGALAESGCAAALVDFKAMRPLYDLRPHARR